MTLAEMAREIEKVNAILSAAPERIRSKIRVDETGCWLWGGAINPKGYGRVWSGRVMVFCHQLMFDLAYGEDRRRGMEIDHMCRNRACCNPLHLEAVTHKENLMRGEGITKKNADKHQCPRCFGPYTLRLAKSGLRVGSTSRYCKACRNIKDKERLDANPELRARIYAAQRAKYHEKKQSSLFAAFMAACKEAR